jgi:hypothetical protein
MAQLLVSLANSLQAKEVWLAMTLSIGRGNAGLQDWLL